MNGTEQVVRGGKWKYTGADLVTISNNVGADPYSGRAHPEAHGRLFVKKILPQATEIVKVGGSGHEFERDDGSVPAPDSRDYFVLKENGAIFVGTCYTDIVATEPRTDENFLVVLQTADTNDPTQAAAMTPTELIESQKLQGAFIRQSTGQPNHVVLFARNEEVLDLRTGVTLTYTYGSAADTGQTRHLVNDLLAGRTYDVIDTDLAAGVESKQMLTVADTRTKHAKERGELAAGALSFTTTLTRMQHRIQIVESGVQPTPPPPPPVTNKAPVVNAGPDQTITLPSDANLNGTVTDDGLPNPPKKVTALWSKVSGPGTVTFKDVANVKTDAAFSTDGTYVLRLTANDSQLSASDDMTVTVKPKPPRGSKGLVGQWKFDGD